MTTEGPGTLLDEIRFFHLLKMLLGMNLQISYGKWKNGSKQ